MRAVWCKVIKRVNNKKKKTIRREKIKLATKMMEKKVKKVKMAEIKKNKKLQEKLLKLLIKKINNNLKARNMMIFSKLICIQLIQTK